MARRSRRTGKKRGRPYNPNSKRNQTTRAGRRGDIDAGQARLIANKTRLTGRPDVEMTPAGALYGLGHLDNAQYSTLGAVTRLLRRVSVAMGGLVSPARLWTSLLAAGSRPSSFLPPLIGDQSARLQLARACRELNGCKSLVIDLAEEITVPPLVLRAIRRELTYHDMVMLEELRRALDDLQLPRSAREDEAHDRPNTR
jgi:hypothetical protein